MKLKVLGTAAATSMPLLFCNCPVCRAARQNGGKDLRKRSAALIDETLLIDLSPDLGAMAAMHDFDPAKIRYLLQTHSHSDHFDAGHFVTRAGGYATQNPTPLDVVCSAGTFRDMARWVAYNEPSFDLYSAACQKNMAFRPRLLREFESIQLGAYRVTALDSLHAPDVEAFIYLIERGGKALLYGTDLLEIKPEVWRFLEGRRLDAVLLDQTYGAGCNAGGHLDAGQVAKLVRRMRELGVTDETSRIYATHISHEEIPSTGKWSAWRRGTATTSPTTAWSSNCKSPLHCGTGSGIMRACRDAEST